MYEEVQTYDQIRGTRNQTLNSNLAGWIGSRTRLCDGLRLAGLLSDGVAFWHHIQTFDDSCPEAHTTGTDCSSSDDRVFFVCLARQVLTNVTMPY